VYRPDNMVSGSHSGGSQLCLALGSLSVNLTYSHMPGPPKGNLGKVTSNMQKNAKYALKCTRPRSPSGSQSMSEPTVMSSCVYSLFYLL
jgi:hypothetical protein